MLTRVIKELKEGAARVPSVYSYSNLKYGFSFFEITALIVSLHFVDLLIYFHFKKK